MGSSMGNFFKDDLVKHVFYFRTKSLLSGSPTELVVLTRLLEPGQFLMKFSVVFLLGALLRLLATTLMQSKYTFCPNSGMFHRSR